jgi:O-antigen/teichoic acid export membrane protein
MPERATLYAMGNRLFGAAGGLLTAALVAVFFTPELQGYYYTFLSLLTLQTLTELGFGELLQQFVSHEWARGSQRLRALVRFSLLWYAGAAGLLFLVLGIGGSVYFGVFPHGADQGEADWPLAWWLASLATALSVVLTPLFSLVEGANRVSRAHGVRLTQGVASRLAGLVAIPLGAGLVTIVVTRLVSLAIGIGGLGREARELWRRSPSSTGPFPYRRELLPLQWKFAMSCLSGYVLYSLFTPIAFAVEGPVVAGQFGMTLAAAGAIASAAFAAVATKVPRLALYAASGEFRAMDSLFHRATLSSVAVSAAGASLFLGALVAARESGVALAARFLPTLETSILLGTFVLQQVRFAMGSYLRAHKQEPFLALSLFEGLVAVPLFLLLGRRFGALGMVAGFFALTFATLVPAVTIFERCRALWHGPVLVRTNDASPL